MLHKKFVSKILPRKDEIAALEKFVDKRLKKISWLNDSFDEVFFSGGTGRAIAKIHRLHFGNDFHDTINGYVMKNEDLFQILDYYRTNKDDFVKELIKEAPDRIHTVVPGLILYTRIMKLVKIKSIKVSLFGIREGYLVKNIVNKTTQEGQMS
jgi:exopolyphosphatase/guanosine-5'-triphosphate,3'-diphosphate pyrophosphatase